MPKGRDSVLVMTQVSAPEGQGDTLVGTIKSLTGLIQSRSGCSSCHIYQDILNPEEMALLQEWESEEMFNAHVGSKDYRFILEWMEAIKPEVTICKNPDHKGFRVIMDLLYATDRQKEAVRGAGRAHSGKAS
jgi:quinol monooxygenase YgiN